MLAECWQYTLILQMKMFHTELITGCKIVENIIIDPLNQLEKLVMKKGNILNINEMARKTSIICSTFPISNGLFFL